MYISKKKKNSSINITSLQHNFKKYKLLKNINLINNDIIKRIVGN